MTPLDILLSVLLLLINAALVLVVAMSLPGTWLMVLVTAIFAWARWDEEILGWPTLVLLLSLALVGEAIELVAAALGVRSRGGSARGALGAMLGGVAGGILGTFLIPVPVLGSILGAAAGSFLGALAGEFTMGKELEAAVETGKGAFIGRLLGSLSKVALSVVMWLVVAFAIFI
jgi:hypothetical protein